jgi:hypothetical protein
MACAFGEEEVDAIAKLGLLGVTLQSTFVEDHRSIRALHLFVDPSQLGQSPDVVRIQFQGLVQASLGTRQVARLVEEPTIFGISRCRPRGAFEPVFDHRGGFAASITAYKEHGECMTANGVVWSALQTLSVPLLCVGNIAEAVMALAEVVEECRVFRLESQGGFKAFARVAVPAMLEEMDAVLVIGAESVVRDGGAAGQTEQQSEYPHTMAHSASSPADDSGTEQKRKTDR